MSKKPDKHGRDPRIVQIPTLRIHRGSPTTHMRCMVSAMAHVCEKVNRDGVCIITGFARRNLTAGWQHEYQALCQDAVRHGLLATLMHSVRNLTDPLPSPIQPYGSIELWAAAQGRLINPATGDLHEDDFDAYMACLESSRATLRSLRMPPRLPRSLRQLGRDDQGGDGVSPFGVGGR